MSRSLLWTALLVALVAFACATPVPPEAIIYSSIPADAPNVLYVSSNDERDRVVHSLEQAGFRVTSDVREPALALSVRLGSRRWRHQCGAVRNVAYELMNSGVRVALIKGRGFTGSCSPNILDDMSAELARLFG